MLRLVTCCQLSESLIRLPELTTWIISSKILFRKQEIMNHLRREGSVFVDCHKSNAPFSPFSHALFSFIVFFSPSFDPSYFCSTASFFLTYPAIFGTKSALSSSALLRRSTTTVPFSSSSSSFKVFYLLLSVYGSSSFLWLWRWQEHRIWILQRFTLPTYQMHCFLTNCFDSYVLWLKSISSDSFWHVPIFIPDVFY